MLVAPLKRSTRSASLPVCPSSVNVFIRLRVPPIFGVAVPKVSPRAALSVLALTPGMTRSSATMSLPFDCNCSICLVERSSEFSELDVWTCTVSARTETNSATVATFSDDVAERAPLVGGEHDTGALGRLESVELHLDRVGAGDQRRERENRRWRCWWSRACPRAFVAQRDRRADEHLTRWNRRADPLI